MYYSKLPQISNYILSPVRFQIRNRDTSVYWAKIKEKMTKLGTKSVYNILAATTMSDIIYSKVVIYY